MPAFAVSAIDRMGIRRSLLEVAPDEPELREKLRQKSLWPVRVHELPPDRKLARLRLPTREFIALLNQLELQIRAGVTADVALAQLAADTAPGRLRTLLAHLHRNIAQGTPIHAACRTFARQFPPHLAAVIAAGEASAQLPDALRALAAHVTAIDELRRTTRRALIYPAIVLTATIALVFFLLGGVVPRFAEIFASMQMTLPAVTVALIRTSELVRDHWLLITVVFALTGVGAWFASRTAAFRWFGDAALLRAPLLGEIVRCLATARFAAHCRLLVEAGIPLLDALATGAELTGNAVLSGQLLRARESVAVGRPLYAALPPKHAFPAFLVPALKSGETTGQLPAALHHIESYAATAARERVATALTFLEPILLAALAAIVGVIVFAFFLPLLGLLGGFNTR